MRAGLQLVDRRGPADEAEIAQFGAALEEAAAALAMLATVPDSAEALARARELDRFCGEVDIRIAVHVANENTPFPGARVDAVAKASLTGLLADLVQRRQLTVFITSHVLEVVERLCDMVGVIHGGRLVAQGTLQDVVQAAPGAANLTEAFVQLVGEGRPAARALSFLP